VPCASLDEAAGWEAGTGPTKIGTITDAGMRGIDDAEDAAEDGSTSGVSLVACSDVEVEVKVVGCAPIGAGSGDRSDAVKSSSTLTVDSDAETS
jgi:hypothetical protein